MKKKTRRMLTGVAITSALAVSMTVPAFAEEQEPPETPEVTIAADEIFNEAVTPLPEKKPEVKPEPTVLVDGTDPTQDGSGWNASTKSGWRYDDKTGTVSMVNNQKAVDIHAEGQGVELSVAGFNRIDTLYADGNVNITGTGILLIDKIDMLDGTDLNLLTNSDIFTDGSAAVFLKQDDGTYKLINGDIPGILDEGYSVPEGIHLVIPDGSRIEMRSTTLVTVTTKVMTEEDGETVTGESTHYGLTEEDLQAMNDHSFYGYDQPWKTIHVDCSSPTLAVDLGAVLTIENGAGLHMEANSVPQSPTSSLWNRSTLLIDGTLNPPEWTADPPGYTEIS